MPNLHRLRDSFACRRAARLTTTEPAVVVIVERFGAFGLLGLLFCLAYPRRIALVCALVFGSAVVLELLQIVIADRDARVIDAVEKLVGGAAGIVSSRALHSIAGRLGCNLKLAAPFSELSPQSFCAGTGDSAGVRIGGSSRYYSLVRALEGKLM